MNFQEYNCVKVLTLIKFVLLKQSHLLYTFKKLFVIECYKSTGKDMDNTMRFNFTETAFLQIVTSRFNARSDKLNVNFNYTLSQLLLK